MDSHTSGILQRIQMNKIANKYFCRGQLFAKYELTYEQVQQIRDLAKADEQGVIKERTAPSCTSDVSYLLIDYVVCLLFMDIFCLL